MGGELIRYRQCLRRREIEGAEVAKRLVDCAVARAVLGTVAGAARAQEIEGRLRNAMVGQP